MMSPPPPPQHSGGTRQQEQAFENRLSSTVRSVSKNISLSIQHRLGLLLSVRTLAWHAQVHIYQTLPRVEQEIW